MPPTKPIRQTKPIVCPDCGSPTDKLTPLDRLNKDLEAAAALLSPAEVRYLCGRYYVMQDQRKRAASQVAEARKAGEPNILLQFDLAQSRLHEGQIKTTMLHNARSTLPGRWMNSIFGIGPVISAGLLAHIDIHQAPTVGHIYTFAGLNPKVRWIGRAEADAWVKTQQCADLDNLLTLAAATFNRRYDTLYRDATTDFKTQTQHALTRATISAAIARRPWNAALKVLCWHAGQCFKRFSNNPKDTLYGKLYREYKVKAVRKNLEGGFAVLAAQTLAERTIRDPATRAVYEAGRLPDGRVDSWATRATVKIFLSHVHHVLYACTYGKEPPMPYILATQPEKHTQYIPPPHWPQVPGEAEQIEEE